MTAQDTAMKTAYEVEGMSPDEIAIDQNLNVMAVKGKLMEISGKFRKDAKLEPLKEDRLNFSDYQLETVTAHIFEMAIGAETPDGLPDYKVQADLCKYVRDDKKGRKEVLKLMQNNQFNIFDMNQKLSVAQEKARKAKELIEV